MNNVYVYILAIFELHVKGKYDVDLHSEKFNDWDWYNNQLHKIKKIL